MSSSLGPPSSHPLHNPLHTSAGFSATAWRLQPSALSIFPGKLSIFCQASSRYNITIDFSFASSLRQSHLLPQSQLAFQDGSRSKCSLCRNYSHQGCLTYADMISEPLLRPRKSWKCKIRRQTCTYPQIRARCHRQRSIHGHLWERCSLLGARRDWTVRGQGAYGARS